VIRRGATASGYVHHVTAPRLALIGGGSMGALHARVIAASERAELAVIVDPRPEVGQALATTYESTWVPDLASLVDLDSIAGVIVAATTEAHRDLVMPIIAAGKPVLVEKPIAASLSETEEIVEASRQANVPLMCGLLERYNGAVMTALALVREPVHVASIRHSPYAPRIRTGVSWDLLVHDVDLITRIFDGEPDHVLANAGQFHPSSVAGAEDFVEATLRFPNGGVATASASRLGQRKIRSLVITELDRSIEVDLLRRDVTIYRHVANSGAIESGLGYRQQTIIEIPELISAREPLAVQLDRFVDLIEGKIDAAAERDSLLPAHRIVAACVSQ